MAEKFYVKAGDPRAAIEMYTKANMYEAAHQVYMIISNVWSNRVHMGPEKPGKSWTFV